MHCMSTETLLKRLVVVLKGECRLLNMVDILARATYSIVAYFFMKLLMMKFNTTMYNKLFEFGYTGIMSFNTQTLFEEIIQLIRYI